MINYSLKCSNKHSFDSWFQSADAFEKLQNKMRELAGAKGLLEEA